MNTKILVILLLNFFLLSLSKANSIYAPLAVRKGLNSSNHHSYQYDTAGNRLVGSYLDDSYKIQFGLISKPELIDTLDGKETFRYGPKGSRYLRVNADFLKTLYVQNMEYRINSGVPKSIIHVHNGNYSPVVQIELSENNNPIYRYYVQDHQGTALLTVSNDGMPVNQRRFDPWGLRVAATGKAESKKQIDETTRGFTGHETIKSAGLFHANGRVCDPLVGFISPDPRLNKKNLVSHNLYAYTLNSPLNHVDPSGYAPYRLSEPGRVAKAMGIRRNEYHTLLRMNYHDSQLNRELLDFEREWVEQIPDHSRNYRENVRRSPSLLAYRQARTNAYKRYRRVGMIQLHAGILATSAGEIARGLAEAEMINAEHATHAVAVEANRDTAIVENQNAEAPANPGRRRKANKLTADLGPYWRQPAARDRGSNRLSSTQGRGPSDLRALYQESQKLKRRRLYQQSRRPKIEFEDLPEEWGLPDGYESPDDYSISQP